ncbi:hypothetical protein OGAPHI_005910 [Ogataea philodendri]|uniref:MAGE domain-containing protein n=1 Tax=Ogataea philodendri TaxID=1378263 RepID=A0A9P8NYD2_9ASCO|nr:uncharacterized protein OGAPHI_005910 [Ogataea philodendri]KAH3661732.1 hypothetical protein OGAPHI_005910 [Ogataea philodendri]
MPKRRNSFDDYEQDDDYEEPVRKSRRVQTAGTDDVSEDSGSEFESDSPTQIPNSRDDLTSRLSIREQRVEKLVNAFVRALLPLEHKHQVLNKGLVAKIMEMEDEKGHGVQFKKHLLPGIRSTLERVFGLELIELPPKKGSKSSSSDDYILVNKLSSTLKDEIYKYFQTQSRAISSLADLKESSSSSSSLMKTGATLPKPVNELIGQGFKMLIIAIILLNDNNINKQDLLNILKTKFQLNFKETKSVGLLGMTVPEFLYLLVKQEYLEQLDVSQTSSKNKRRTVISNKSTDDNMLIYSIGRRSIAELDQDNFIDFLKKMYPNWNEELEKSALYTLNNVWKPQQEDADQSA